MLHLLCTRRHTCGLPGGAKSFICASTRIPPLGSVDRNSVTSSKLPKELMCTAQITCACVSVCTHTVYAGAAVPVTTAWPSPTDQAHVCGRVVPNKCEARRKHFRWSIVEGDRRMSANPLVGADRYAVQQKIWSRKPVMNPRESIYTFQWLSACLRWSLG